MQDKGRTYLTTSVFFFLRVFSYECIIINSYKKIKYKNLVIMAVAWTMKYTFYWIFMTDIEKITSFVQNTNNTEAFHEKKLVKFANLLDSLR